MYTIVFNMMDISNIFATGTIPLKLQNQVLFKNKSGNRVYIFFMFKIITKVITPY